MKRCIKPLAALILACSSALAGNAEIWPEKDWVRSTPEAQGIDSAPLVEMMEQFGDNRRSLHSLLIIRNGVLVFDATLFPFAPGRLHDIASCSKTVTATTLGIAIGEGRITGPDAALTDVFQGRSMKNVDARKRAIRLDDLLTMRSGLFCIQDGISQFQMFQNPDWIQFCLDLPAWKPAGSTFQYFSLNSHLLSAAVQQATGKKLADYANEKLFQPIGIQKFGWPADPQGVTRGWGDLRLQPEDMARLGLLFLRGGKWRDRQVVPKAWIDAMIASRVNVGRGSHFTGYGYQIWLWPEGFSFRGRGCQRIFVKPKDDLIVVTTAGASDADEAVIDRAIFESILPAVRGKDPLPENPNAVRRLNQLKEALRRAPSPTPVAMPPMATKISGKTYTFDPNPYIRELTLTFSSPTEGKMRLALPPIHGMSDLGLAVGLDGVARFTPGRYGEPAAVKGRWEGDAFHVDFDEVGNINHWNIVLAFTGDDVSLTMREETDLPTVRSKGRRK